AGLVGGAPQLALVVEAEAGPGGPGRTVDGVAEDDRDAGRFGVVGRERQHRAHVRVGVGLRRLQHTAPGRIAYPDGPRHQQVQAVVGLGDRAAPVGQRRGVAVVLVVGAEQPVRACRVVVGRVAGLVVVVGVAGRIRAEGALRLYRGAGGVGDL